MKQQCNLTDDGNLWTEESRTILCVSICAKSFATAMESLAQALHLQTSVPRVVY